MSVRDRVSQHGATNDPEMPFEPFGAARRDGHEIENPAAFLKKKAPQLYKWLLELFHGDHGINAHMTVRNRTEKGEPLHISISMWGHKHEYVLGVRLPSGKMVPKMVRVSRKFHSRGPHKTKKTRDTGYMGLGSVARAPYAGEQHRRGSDMWDGDFSEKTWRGVVFDILRDTLVELHEWARNQRGDGPRPVMSHLRRKRRRRRITKTHKTPPRSFTKMPKQRSTAA